MSDKIFKTFRDCCIYILAVDEDCYYYNEWQSGIDHYDFSSLSQSEMLNKVFRYGQSYPNSKIQKALEVLKMKGLVLCEYAPDVYEEVIKILEEV
jgi:hypothetical protein